MNDSTIYDKSSYNTLKINLRGFIICDKLIIFLVASDSKKLSHRLNKDKHIAIRKRLDYARPDQKEKK